VLEARRTAAGLRLTVREVGASAELNRRLVEAGVAVSRLEPVRSTLEERFLEITSRLAGAA
jgi:hypothetical protein